MPQGIVIAHRPAELAKIQVLRVEDFEPPLDALNLLTIQQRLGAPFFSFDFTWRGYDASTGEKAGISAALDAGLVGLLRDMDPRQFEELCLKLIEAEGVVLATGCQLNTAPVTRTPFVFHASHREPRCQFPIFSRS